MRLLPGLVIALVVCLVAIALPSAPAQAACGGPAIDLVPGSGVPGTQLIVQGQHYDPGMHIDVYYDGVLMSEGTKTSATGAFSIPFIIPESCKGDHQIIVDVESNSIGIIKKETTFYATAGLTVNPSKGPVGTNVTVTGHGFVKNEHGIKLMYYTDGGYDKVGTNIIANAQGHWEASFQIPASNPGEHKIGAQGDFSQSYDVNDANFTVTAGITINKSSGGVGENITMTGSRFEDYEQDIQILFNGQAVVTGINADSQGNWQKTFDVPDMPAGNYTVTAAGEYTLEQDIIGLNFEIKPSIVLSPTTGHVGTNVTVTGYGFIADKYISIMYDGSQQTTGTTNDQGGFKASFIVPASEHGEHNVTIGYSSTNVAGATFTMESQAPDTPQLISPSNRARVGFVGRVATPTFEWSSVTDESGVSYNLQIATSPDVTAGGGFVNPLISVTGLTGTSYTVTQALPHGTYYWIVQAVDGAQNQGSWTAARVLRVGLLPLWAFIVIIVAIVVLITALIVAAVRRRRYYWW